MSGNVEDIMKISDFETSKSVICSHRFIKYYQP